jgi:hypothetical protein
MPLWAFSFRGHRCALMDSAPHCILRVVTRSAVAQIAYLVIGFDVIPMAHLHPVGAGAEERSGDQSVHQFLLDVRNADDEIPLAVRRLLQLAPPSAVNDTAVHSGV